MGCGRASSLYIEQKNSQELNLVRRGREAVRAFFVALTDRPTEHPDQCQ